MTLYDFTKYSKDFVDIQYAPATVYLYYPMNVTNSSSADIYGTVSIDNDNYSIVSPIDGIFTISSTYGTEGTVILFEMSRIKLSSETTETINITLDIYSDFDRTTLLYNETKEFQVTFINADDWTLYYALDATTSVDGWTLDSGTLSGAGVMTSTSKGSMEMIKSSTQYVAGSTQIETFIISKSFELPDSESILLSVTNLSTVTTAATSVGNSYLRDYGVSILLDGVFIGGAKYDYYTSSKGYSTAGTFYGTKWLSSIVDLSGCTGTATISIIIKVGVQPYATSYHTLGAFVDDIKILYK